jgi:poly(beta-D-mannuronate) lyase
MGRTPPVAGNVGTVPGPTMRVERASPSRRLASPFGIIPQKGPATSVHKCTPPPEAFVGALEFASKYEGSGRSRDTLNPEAEARYRLATRSIQAFEAGLARLTDQHVRGAAGSADCAWQWLHAWARAGALTGTANMTGKAVRKWALAAIAFNRLKVGDSCPLGAAERRTVDDWMRGLAQQVIDENDDLPSAKINNHYYWAAAAVGATGVALDDRELFDWAMEAYRRSVRDIDAEGVLPRELARRTRALSYHAYALQPLVMLAEMGRVNGIDLYAEADCALCRLVRRVSEGVQDPGYFEQRTGARQAMEEGKEGNAMTWVVLLSQACPGDSRLKRLDADYQPFVGRRLGGNLTDLFQHTRKERTHAINTQACDHLWR